MERDRFQAVNQCIRDAARLAAAPGGLSVSTIETFLRSAKETWDGAGSGRFTPAQFQNDAAYRRAARDALRILFRLLSELLPAEAHLVSPVPAETIQERIEPMVKGLVQPDWQQVAVRELVASVGGGEKGGQFGG
jgi:hypothetical protein